MNNIVIDDEMEKQIEAGTATVKIVNSKGTVVGVVMPVKVPRSRPSREEIERRLEEARKNPGQGKTLTEVWAAIHAKYGENP